jgi:hypothetical protein
MATAPNSEVSTQIDTLANANPDGATFGQSVSDKINFYGRIPQPQRVVSAVSLLTSSAATSSVSAWGYYASTAVGTASTYSFSSFVVSAYATATVGSILSEVVNTLAGLGLWKAASV